MSCASKSKPSISRTKSLSSVGSPILACNDLTSNAGTGLVAENARRLLKERVFHCLSWLPCHVELLAEFHQRLSAPGRGKRHFRLEAGLWLRRGRLVMLSAVSASKSNKEFHSSALFKFPGPALNQRTY